MKERKVQKKILGFLIPLVKKHDDDDDGRKKKLLTYTINCNDRVFRFFFVKKQNCKFLHKIPDTNKTFLNSIFVLLKIKKKFSSSDI